MSGMITAAQSEGGFFYTLEKQQSTFLHPKAHGSSLVIDKQLFLIASGKIEIVFDVNVVWGGGALHCMGANTAQERTPAPQKGKHLI